MCNSIIMYPRALYISISVRHLSLIASEVPIQSRNLIMLPIHCVNLDRSWLIYHKHSMASFHKGQPNLFSYLDYSFLSYTDGFYPEITFIIML